MIDARIVKSFPALPGSPAFSLNVHISTGAGVTVLFGPSGAGKSLTLDAIAGFARPDEGRILVDDVLLFDAASGTDLPPRRRCCGYVFQSSALFPHLSLKQNLGFAAGRLPRLERRRKVGEMLELFHLSEFGGRLPSELSGGQRQRASIARALLAQPRILLLDEPSSGLDFTLRDELYEVLSEVRRAFKTPILLITHDLDEALELGDVLCVFHNGRILQSGPPPAVVDQPASDEVAALLGGFNRFDAEITGLDPAAQSSRLRCTLPGVVPFDIDGPYFPGHLLGARLRLGIRASSLRLGPGGVRLNVVRRSHRLAGARIEYSGGLVAEIPGAADQAANFDAPVLFPPRALRLLR